MCPTVWPLRGSGHDSSVGEWMYPTVCPLHGPDHDGSVREWMYLTVCPLRGQGHDGSVGEWMYPTVCPLHGPGHDSSVREWMYLTVCPLCGQGHDGSVGEWMYPTVCPLHGPGHDSSMEQWMEEYIHTCRWNRDNALSEQNQWYIAISIGTKLSQIIHCSAFSSERTLGDGWEPWLFWLLNSFLHFLLLTAAPVTGILHKFLVAMRCIMTSQVCVYLVIYHKKLSAVSNVHAWWALLSLFNNSSTGTQLQLIVSTKPLKRFYYSWESIAKLPHVPSWVLAESGIVFVPA